MWHPVSPHYVIRVFPRNDCRVEKRMVEKPTNYIVLKKSEVFQLVDRASCQTKGEGAGKLNKEMSQIYCGLSRRIIQRSLTSIKQKQKVRPLFQNKVPSDQLEHRS